MTMDDEATITVNGEKRPFDVTVNIARILEELGIQVDQQGVAVAVNSEIVSRADWPSAVISSGDQIEVVRAIQGGLT